MVDARTSAGGPTWRYAPVAFWLAVVLAASVRPASGDALGATGPLGVGVDAFLHAAGYAVLAALLVRADVSVPRAVLAAVLLGAGVEVVQATLPTRSASLADVAANAVGATAGAGLAAAARHLWRGRSLGGNQLDDGE